MSDYQRPILKWAGNKFVLLEKLLDHIPASGNRFIEPFCGSGSVFTNVKANCTYREYHVGDSNKDLIDLYKSTAANPKDFIKKLQLLFNGDSTTPSGNSRDRYMHLRDVFNGKVVDPVLVAAGIGRSELFVYLNRHCFNGLCRYNSKGQFNVPQGRYKTIKIPDQEILAFSQQSKNVHFYTDDFVTLLDTLQPKADDVVYLDPPYLPLSDTANFTDYSNDGGFPFSKQEELAKLAEKYHALGAIVLVSNHNTSTAQDLYKNATKVLEFDVPRFISGNKDRKKAPELLAIYN